MRIHKLPKSDQVIYEKEFNSGFKTFISPDKNINNFQLSIVIKFGSGIKKFKINEKKYEVPTGVAHFLEHQMFDGKEEILNKWEENGVKYNAFTNRVMTSYYCYGVKEVESSLKVLLDLVFKINISHKSVEKEKGIIEEERKMYEDVPLDKLHEKSISNILVNSQQRNPVIGYKEDIANTKKEDLENCYNNFYIPNNMYLVATGNVDEKQINEIIEDYLSQYKKQDLPVILKEQEPESVFRKKEIIKSDISVERFSKLYKINIQKEFELWEQDWFLYFLIKSNWGLITELNERLLNKKIIKTDLKSYVYLLDDYFVLNLIVETEKAEMLNKIIEKELSTFISKEKFEILKNAEIGSYIKNLDIHDEINFLIMYEYLHFKDIDKTSFINVYNVSYEKMNRYLKNINLNNTCELNLKKRK